MKILVLDRNRNVADTIKSELVDVLVRHVSDGEIGLKQATEKQFDLIVIDCELPKIDGLSVLRGLREKKVLTPVLMLTAEDSVKDTVRYLDTGANDCLAKPYESYVLRARIKALIRRSKWDLCPEIPYPHFKPDPIISILVIDDYESARIAMAHLIAVKLPEIVVHVADIPQQSLELCGKYKIDIAIIDITNTIKSYTLIDSMIKKNSRIKFIVTTAASEKEELYKMFDMNKTYILRKPLNVNELFASINMNVSEIEAERLAYQP